jgi:putative dimethyl sulfoxide reductase chaperone
VTDQARNDEPVQIAQARGAIYRLLSRCFYEPTPQLLEDIARGPSASLLQNLLTTFQVGTLEEMLAPAGNGAARASAGDGSLVESLKAEYDRLFEGPGHVQVPPYESVHRTDVPEIERGLLMGCATLDAKRRYAEAGLAMAKGFTDLPDHIAVELEFMCYLCTKEAEAGGATRDGRFVKAQREFLREHFMKWLPDFSDKVITSSKVQFYRDLAQVMQAYVASEAADLLGKDTTN